MQLAQNYNYNCCFILLINLIEIILKMKSKRKQVNKFLNKQEQNEEALYNDQIMKRTSGIKPFHLSKVRLQTRKSQQLFNLRQNDDINRIKYNTFSKETDKGDVYLDLLIQKKLLVDVQRNQRLMSQRKNVVYLDLQKKLQDQIDIVNYEGLNSNETEVNMKYLQYVQSELEVGNTKIQKQISPLIKKHKSKCECCQQINGHSSQAIICKKDMFQTVNHYSSSEKSNSDKQSSRGETIDPKAELKIITERASKSPFSFTNIKWRSKSQIFQVDKWKQKYGHSINSSNNYSPIKRNNSNSKICKSKEIDKRKQRENYSPRKNSIDVNRVIEVEKMKFPSIKSTNNIQHQKNEIQIIPQQNTASNQIQISANINKIEKQIHQLMRQKSELIFNKQQQISNDSETKQLKKIKNQILIKQMYTNSEIILKEQKFEQNIAKQMQKQNKKLQTSKGFEDKSKKKKKSKPKFPEIKVTTFYSMKQNDDEKKKTKYVNLQRIAQAWKQKPPKKIFLQKMLDQIPQRWQYGQSRQYSREEVDDYMKIKKQQSVKQQIILQLQSKRFMDYQLKQIQQQVFAKAHQVRQYQQQLILNMNN